MDLKGLTKTLFYAILICSEFRSRTLKTPHMRKKRHSMRQEGYGGAPPLAAMQQAKQKPRHPGLTILFVGMFFITVCLFTGLFTWVMGAIAIGLTLAFAFIVSVEPIDQGEKKGRGWRTFKALAAIAIGASIIIAIPIVAIGLIIGTQGGRDGVEYVIKAIFSIPRTLAEWGVGGATQFAHDASTPQGARDAMPLIKCVLGFLGLIAILKVVRAVAD